MYERINCEKFKEVFKPRGTDTFKLKNFKSKNEIYNIPMSFDIETTLINDSIRPRSYMWIWQLGFILNDVQYVCKGSTWEEFENTFRYISEKIGHKRVLCLVHNLPFEFGFLRGRFGREISEMFCKQSDNPIKFVLFGNIEFRDTLSLSNSSLAKLAKDYTKTQKMVGDLDYSIIRNSSYINRMTDEEECYCDNDVIILCEYFQFIVNHLYMNETIPLTQTGILRRDVQESAISLYMNRYDVNRTRARKRLSRDIMNLAPSERLYHHMMNYVFQGGLSHSQAVYCNQILEGLDSFDYTSSYIAIMLQDCYYFPAKFHSVPASWENLRRYMKTHCVMWDIEFVDLNAKTGHSIISESKCNFVSIEKIIDNGRIAFAKDFITSGVEMDLETIEKFYSYNKEESKVLRLWVADRIELPSYLKDNIVLNLVAKQKKKIAKENYVNEKSKLNAGYGLCVQRQIEQQYEWDGKDFVVADADSYEKQMSKSVLLPQHGVYITAWARKNLCDAIYMNHKNIVTYDTDSIKGWFDDEAMEYINAWNESRIKMNKRIAEKYGCDFECIWDLGCWECETTNGKYDVYKTLGSKRYMYMQNDELHQTIAGLPKSYLPTRFKEHPMDAFDFFARDMLITDSEKLQHIVNTEYHSDFVDGEFMEEYSSISLVQTTFTLTMKEIYVQLIQSRQEELKNLEKRLI